MGFWEVVLKVVLISILVWLSLGLVATVFPHRWPRLRAKLVILSRRSLERGVNLYARRRGESPTALRRRYPFADTEAAHLARVYRGLVLSGPYAFILLWRARQVKLPGDANPPARKP